MLRQQLARCQETIAGKEQLIESIYASSSWRITRPWRAAKQLLARRFG
jgi:hypothetical protein